MTVSAPMKDQVQEQALDDEILSGGESVYVAPPWKLMWWRFRKHKMAMVSAVILLAFYFTAAFCEFVAPYDQTSRSSSTSIRQPQESICATQRDDSVRLSSTRRRAALILLRRSLPMSRT